MPRKATEARFEYETPKTLPDKYILIAHEGEGKSLNVTFEGNWKAKEILFVQHQVSKAFKRYQLQNRRAETLENEKLLFENQKEEANE